MSNMQNILKAIQPQITSTDNSTTNFKQSIGQTANQRIPDIQALTKNLKELQADQLTNVDRLIKFNEALPFMLKEGLKNQPSTVEAPSTEPATDITIVKTGMGPGGAA